MRLSTEFNPHNKTFAFLLMSVSGFNKEHSNCQTSIVKKPSVSYLMGSNFAVNDFREKSKPNISFWSS